MTGNIKYRKTKILKKRNGTTEEKRSGTTVFRLKATLTNLLKSKYMWYAVAILLTGFGLNFYSQIYLHNYMVEGKSLPMLNDLILDNLPFWEISMLYDIFAIFSLVIFTVYIVHKKKLNKLPYFLLLIGILYIMRGVFTVLTPFGNPPMFDGTNSIFNGFMKYELGVYPSGHTGLSFLLFFMTQNKTYRYILLASLVFIIVSLFLSKAHYSIDVLSGIIFAYAIGKFGEKNFQDFIISKQ